MDSSDDLGDDNEPCVYADQAKALLEGGFDLGGGVAPCKPQGEEAEDVLEVVGGTAVTWGEGGDRFCIWGKIQ